MLWIFGFDGLIDLWVSEEKLINIKYWKIGGSNPFTSAKYLLISKLEFIQSFCNPLYN